MSVHGEGQVLPKAGAEMSLLSWSADLGARSRSTEGLPVLAVTLALAPPAPLLQAVQSIGNLGQQLGQGKEMWMAPLHPFLLQSISRVRDFLDQLVDVDGEEGEFLWPCHVWLVTPLDPRDLPFHPTPPLQSTETVGQIVSQRTFSATYCAFPANAEM